MKAVRIEKFGLDGLSLVEMPAPSQPRKGEIIVKLKAISLNFRDLLMIKGLYNPDQPLPLIPCSDGAGEVVAVAEDVQSVKVGDRVVGTFFQNWNAGPYEKRYGKAVLGGPLDGTLAEYICLKEEGVVPIPRHLSFEEASTLPCAALTAWNAIVEQAKVTPGQTVVVQGSGGVSLFALQFALACGAEVIFLSRNEEKIKRAKELGAREGINTSRCENWSHELKELTEGRGADVIVNVLGADLNECVKSVSFGGLICAIGILKGVRTEVDVVSILMRQVKIQGIYVGNRLMFESMNRAIEKLNIKPIIGQHFSFDRYREAFSLLESGNHFGKIVIKMAE
ncbi:NAD(P)-dependent alcohol dehydrogenase [Methylacidiphilum caldifontis]|uniref:zinc-dependent alcohol dehydrogenase family protein n=1 Tax=Methylacidiphilum caldifontis TaxID=2795386 RepID=UPI001A8C845E|nr:NAD(P)-dependent alcohol dehydrogenase [Methylacidiphilum caldifontis]QSR88614.1 NAD(P)-dependent alcohol dehydrogenase [Methylacidiphilum caldifontis]